jgi:hypothetical protein
VIGPYGKASPGHRTENRCSYLVQQLGGLCRAAADLAANRDFVLGRVWELGLDLIQKLFVGRQSCSRGFADLHGCWGMHVVSTRHGQCASRVLAAAMVTFCAF